MPALFVSREQTPRTDVTTPEACCVYAPSIVRNENVIADAIDRRVMRNHTPAAVVYGVCEHPAWFGDLPRSWRLEPGAPPGGARSGNQVSGHGHGSVAPRRATARAAARAGRNISGLQPTSVPGQWRAPVWLAAGDHDLVLSEILQRSCRFQGLWWGSNSGNFGTWRSRFPPVASGSGVNACVRLCMQGPDFVWPRAWRKLIGTQGESEPCMDASHQLARDR
jgi:hypothetical protein